MPSNISTFELKLARHFTAIELVELLEIPVEDIIDKFNDLIYEYENELRAEIE